MVAHVWSLHAYWLSNSAPFIHHRTFKGLVLRHSQGPSLGLICVRLAVQVISRQHRTSPSPLVAQKQHLCAISASTSNGCRRLTIYTRY